MGTRSIRRDRVDMAIDWLAEFTSEEPRDVAKARSAPDDDVQPQRLIDLPLQPSASDERAREPRLIPLTSPEAPLTASWPPPPQTRRFERRLSVPETAVVSVAMVAIVAGLLATATVWNRTTQMVDPAVLLARAPEPPPIETPVLSVAPLAPPVSPIGSPPVVPTPRPSAKPESRAKRPAPAKPQPSSAAGRAAKTAPPRAGARATPAPSQTLDRQRAAAIGGTAVTGAAPTPTPTPTSAPPSAPPPPVATPPATLNVAPPVATGETTLPARAGTDAGAPPSAPTERAIQTAAIQSVLDRYRLAFSTLSVEGLGTVWRTVDTKALARAFDQLEKQTVEFDGCKIDIYGELAEASCNGRTSFVPKIGARTPRVESRRWAFRLVRVRGGWVIDRVDSR